jgi:hypothetical protein
MFEPTYTVEVRVGYTPETGGEINQFVESLVRNYGGASTWEGRGGWLPDRIHDADVEWDRIIFVSVTFDAEDPNVDAGKLAGMMTAVRFLAQEIGEDAIHVNLHETQSALVWANDEGAR